MINFSQLILGPVATEKAVRATAEGQYAFYVTRDANKVQIAQAIHALYGIHPLKVSMVNLPKKFTGRGRMKRAIRRKAIVVLGKGKKLDPLKLKNA